MMIFQALKSRGFIYRQFLVSPTDLGIPNQRSRYFLIAKRGKKMKFHFDPYVKNWKRKSTPTEPDAKKAKIEENEETNAETLDEAEEDLEKEIEEHIHDEIKGNY